ncbi:helix-turn-helix domain-containing protein [Magnetospirillum sp. 15-1]|uniref:helix-turn-helix domain-containing protein n=1 Tax=Magnetospirillum sp. 15-1 TaxID=1979370 RepID=UPI000BBC74C2|nr:helix-turn-helix domain-containing protein [Magnetospirillum sp. 15-1]
MAITSTRTFHEPRRESGFMSRRQVAEEFGFSVGYLNQLSASELPFHKIGSKVLYERDAVVAWIRGVRQQPSAAPTMAARRRGRPPKPVIDSQTGGAAAASNR